MELINVFAGLVCTFAAGGTYVVRRYLATAVLITLATLNFGFVAIVWNYQ